MCRIHQWHSRRLSFFRSAKPIDLQSHDGPVIAYASRIDLDAPKHFLNTLTITSTNPSPTAPPPAILLHGYGAGLGFFFRNFNPLAQWAGQHGSAVYAVDWLGMGRSARVPFSVKTKRDDIPGRVREAESFFVDSLEQWRAKVGLEKMTLVGHSLGAYFSVAYALKYPSRVNKLVLLSPAGVPHDPNTTMPSREFTDSGDTQSLGGTAEPVSASKLTRIRSHQEAEKKQESRTRRLFTYLWEEGWSPFQVVRASLFWGPWMIGKVSFARPSNERTSDGFVSTLVLF
jgi:cardiolipin-specific phospholipase